MKSGWLGGAAACALLCMLANTAMAEEAAATSEAAAVATADEVVVFGRGQSREVQTINAQEIERAVAGVSPIKIVQKLPGVNFQSADAFGAYEWSTRISIRGFNQNQLGFTLDGVPLGDMTYGNLNGLHISRAVISENLGSVVLAQGAGSLATASSSNLGGTLEFFSRDPSETFGVNVQGTYGSDNMYRGFVRLDTGALPTGGKAYVSYANQKTDKWKGWGEQKQEQANVKFVQPIGEATITAFYDWSQRRENDYQDMSKEMINRLGYGWDNISNNWAAANQIADTALGHYLATGTSGDPAFCVSDPGDGTNVYPAPVRCDDDAYFDAGGLRDDDLWYLNAKTPIGENLKVSATYYGHKNKGQGSWFAPLNPSPNFGVAGATTGNSSISFRTTEYSIDRQGVFGDVELTLGDHVVRAGGWYEDNDFEQARRYYALDRAAPNRDALDFQSNFYRTRWHYAFKTKTTQFFLEDAWSVTQDLKLNFGFKSLKVTNKATFLDGDGPLVNSGSIESKDSFLPQAGFAWNVGPAAGEVFGGYAENMRAFQSAATSGPFSTTQAGFDAIRSRLKPETSKTYELGYRFQLDKVRGQIAAYHVKFDNRLLATAVGAGVAGNPAVLSNVGSVTTKGVEAAATWSITPDWSLFGSYAYNSSKYDDDVFNGSGALVARTSGKTVVDTPKSLANLALSYGHDGWFGSLSGHYTGKRFYTYTNDQSVPSYVIADLTAGYRFASEGWSKGLEVQVNLTNLFDKKYVSTVGSNGFGNSGDAQTLLAGAPRQAFVTVRKDF
ncbi:TonB-dependent receptor [Phenylobacterium sp. LjRoot225]|uniref:TonB-dependent receptor n=1 Tax=Phenylobacterium sp. LjRoot225 TaxID=3342285 RepID=UPI003ECCB4D3